MRALVLVLLLLSVAAADTPTLRCRPEDYVVLAQKKATLKNFTVDAPGCNIGVNCAQVGLTNGCGRLRIRDGSVAAPGQIAADSLCASASFYEVFKNKGGTCGMTCAGIGHPGPRADCAAVFPKPLLADLDGDGTPSCGSACDIDRDDVALACGVTLPVASCDPGHPIAVAADSDCSTDDTEPGNERCDLPAGKYGTIWVRDGGRIQFGAGTTIACALNIGRMTRVTTTGPARILIPGGGKVRLGSMSEVGTGCGQLSVMTEDGDVVIGKFGDYTLDACTIGGRMGLGHGNNLRGHFVGLTVAADSNSHGECCPPTTTTTSTSTTIVTQPEVTPTTTTTTIGGVSTTSTTTIGGASTTTSTTTPGGGTTTTSTTTPPAGFTRTPGFYKTHPSITASILAAVGGVTVCGDRITDVDVDDGHSALEALCITGGGRLQLARHLLTAALNAAAGGAVFDDFARCDAICADPDAAADDVSGCIDAISRFNDSGDQVPLPSTLATGPADPGPCAQAQDTACTVIDRTPCAEP